MVVEEETEKDVGEKRAQDNPNPNHKQDLHRTLYLLEVLNFGIQFRPCKKRDAPTRILKGVQDVAIVEYQDMVTQDVATKGGTCRIAKTGMYTQKGATSLQRNMPLTSISATPKAKGWVYLR